MANILKTNAFQKSFSAFLTSNILFLNKFMWHSFYHLVPSETDIEAELLGEMEWREVWEKKKALN